MPAGEENFFLFGLSADQVAGNRGWYSRLTDLKSYLEADRRSSSYTPIRRSGRERPS